MSDGYLLTPNGWEKEMRIRLSQKLHSAINRMASTESVTVPEMIRRMLEDAVGLEAEAGAERQKVYAPPSPAPVAKPSRGPIEPDFGAQTAIALFQRGHTGTQIAAILRMPYRHVMAEIGAGVDRIASHRMRSQG